ncbi:ATP-binding cassette domain-containing protein [Paenibacillus alvei]|uniref:Energy-coupling factor transporter ATPase n=1 Tax=Paenibacillus alvei TaxID=44250 RepID=A0AAP6ZYP6_PAEAL|nr:ATP-binding cassette domain-containing protein [Paenibacillus alvei]NEZ44842.1 ATP-binding cassette domain-containing protein [Paenibacillus alvei]NOJ70557.1 energy-coupling factor transporter ATPase [Paenibacillus alvei]
MAIITAERVTYRYHGQGVQGAPALDKLQVTFEQGQFIALLGATGSGKSTLLQHLNGILQPTDGKLQVLEYTFQGGTQERGLKELRRRVGLVFQFPEHQLFEDTVERDLLFGPLQFGQSEEEAKTSARKAMRQVGLSDTLLEKSPFELSGGQIRKVAIATVLASNPEVVVLDEPTATLDPVSRTELIELLYKLCKEEGKTVIMVTHRLDELFAYADSFALMKDGRVTFQGTRSELMAQPERLEEAGILLPATMRLAALVMERTGVPKEKLPCSAAEWAEWIKAQMEHRLQEQGNRRPAEEEE